MSTSTAFSPVQLGRFTLKHRIALAPLTRCRADKDGQIPNALMAEYYGQRASDGGLLITEATPILPVTRFADTVPCIYTPEQVEAWKPVTEAVHAKNGVIFMQLWHIGFHCHPRYDPDQRNAPPSSSVYEREGRPTSRELSVDELKEYVQAYATAAKNAIAAGFDGVEIHGANSYLLDQFLSDKVNTRTDEYGGSIENRSRFPLEVVEAVIAAIGADRTGIRFSPWALEPSDPVAQWSYVLERLNPLNLAYVHLVEPGRPADFKDLTPFREVYKGVLIYAGGYEADTAKESIASGRCDLVAFGRWFISNPDLPARIQNDWKLTPYDRSTFYAAEDPVRGYTDYPNFEE
ncbi:hypothetical protein HDU80_005235 [Chytriomyces hyalinus]|nr:hypothetical protein HDU80_005235 [Chytriomyces hyalinus]